MDRRHLYFLLFLLCTIQAAIGQQRSFSIKGVVKDASSGQPIPFANVVVWNTTQGAVTDSTGLFEISGISPGSYRLQSSFLGYKPFVTAEFRLANKDIFFPIELEEASQNLQEVSVVASPFRKTAESPLGLRVIGFKEIEKSAGGNRDISRVVQTFPGVASTAAFRNDLMVRGGGPSEKPFLFGWRRDTEYQPFLYPRSLRRSGRYYQSRFYPGGQLLFGRIPRIQGKRFKFGIGF